MAERVDISSLSNRKTTSNPFQVRYCCPYCGDTKFRLYIHLKKGVFICHRCKVSGKLANLGTPIDNFEERVKGLLYRDSTEDVAPSVDLPMEFLALSRSSGLPYRYLRSRGVMNSEMRKYKLGYCSEGTYAERIILPVYEEGELKSFQARTYTNKIPKYLNVRERKQGIIFKTFEEPVKKAVVVEGIFGAMRVGKIFPAIAIMGKLCSKVQAEKIAKWTKNAYITLDPDAHDYALTSQTVLGFYINTFIRFPRRCPDEMSLDEVRRLI